MKYALLAADRNAPEGLRARAHAMAAYISQGQRRQLRHRAGPGSPHRNRAARPGRPQPGRTQPGHTAQ